VTVISPGVTESELAEACSAEVPDRHEKSFAGIAIPAEAIARAIAFAVEQRTTST